MNEEVLAEIPFSMINNFIASEIDRQTDLILTTGDFQSSDIRKVLNVSTFVNEMLEDELRIFGAFIARLPKPWQLAEVDAVVELMKSMKFGVNAKA